MNNIISGIAYYQAETNRRVADFDRVQTEIRLIKLKEIQQQIEADEKADTNRRLDRWSKMKGTMQFPVKRKLPGLEAEKKQIIDRYYRNKA